MRLNHRLFQLAILACALSASSFAGTEDWVQVDHTDDGITAFRRDIPGSDVVAFRGQGTVDAPIGLVATIIIDDSRATEWIENLKESRLLKSISPFEFVDYVHIGTPIFVSDRDFVTRLTLMPDLGKNKITISYQGTADPSAPKTGYVRGEIISAKFQLSSEDQGKKTYVDGYVHGDPKGSIPKWLVNFFQKDWPVDTFRNLRKQARKPDVHADPRFADLH